MRILLRLRLSVVMAVAFTAEHADSMILAAMYLPIKEALGLTFFSVGTLSTWRAIVQAVLVPFVGILGNMYNRILMISAGTILWGAMSTGMGFSANYAEAAAWCAVNGLGLAMVIPCVQSIYADIWPAKQRGRAFGSLFTISMLAGIGGKVLATGLGREQIGKYDGWRVVFFSMAGVALGATAAVFFGGIEPRDLKPKQAAESTAHPSMWQALKSGTMTILRDTWLVFRIRSFQVILAAGITGGLIGGMFGYKIMWLQLLGFSGWATGLISGSIGLGAACGFLIGGALGDTLHLRFPNAARPFINQLSMAMATPLAILLFKGMPGAAHATGVPGSMDKYKWSYSAVSFGIGILASWPASNNAALFAEIVPEAVRTSVYAFDRSIVGAVGAISTPLSGLLAERVFGAKEIASELRQGKSGVGGAPAPAHAHAAAAHAAKAHASNLHNAHALSNALMTTLLVALVLKFIIYTFLYWTLPRDRIEDTGGAASKEDLANPKDEEDSGGKPPLGPTRGSGKSNTGSRSGSLNRIPSTGRKTPPAYLPNSLRGKYCELPGVDREALRASLAKSVLETADRRVGGDAAADTPEHAGSNRQPLEAQGQLLSWRVPPVETVKTYITLEMTPSFPPSAAGKCSLPQPPSPPHA